MNDALIQSLQITALGMGLVFGAILLLWLMMVILTAVTAEKEPALRHGSASEDSASDSPEVDSGDPGIPLTPKPLSSPKGAPSGGGELERIALLAVAVALAEQGQASARPLAEPPTALVSAWQLGMRTRQMSEKGKMTRR